MEASLDPKTYSDPNFIKNNLQSRVLYVRGIDKDACSISKLYNLFSNYGNILKIKLL